MSMKKFINNPDNLTSELLEGFAIAHDRKIKLQSGKLVVRATPKAQDKVAVVTLGGAGHEPALSGFVGEGMLDVSVVGDIFAAPAAPKVFEALKSMDRPAGVLLVVLNHAGDVLSSDIALEMAAKKNLHVKTIRTHEDIAPGANAPAADRRGLVGCVPLYKIAGAAAEAGRSLDEVLATAERFNNNMATLAVAMKSATHPATGQAIFELEDDEMEIGMGQHGETGTGRCKVKSADDTVTDMLTQLLLAINAKKGDQLLVIVNGVGGTTLMEQYIVLRRCAQILKEKEMTLARSLVGELLTVQEMAGFQLFVAKMDDELLRYWDAPCDTPSLTVR